MANVLHKTSLTYLSSVNTPDYMDGNWLINPDLSIVENVPQKYWKIVDDQLVEMSQKEKDVVDFPLLKSEKILLLNEWWDNKQEAGVLVSAGFRLGITEQDVALLTGAFTLADKAVQLGVKQDIDYFPIIDVEGIVRYLQYGDLVSTLLEYGEVRSTLSATYATLKAQINTATSVADLDNVVFP